VKKIRTISLVLSVFVVLAACGAEFAAADFPDKNRTITFIVGYEPGGTSDSICRVIAGYMTEDLGVPVIIENLPGAANMVALNALMSRPADGYTVTMCAVADSPMAYAASSPENIDWKGDDFRVLGMMTSSPSGMGIIAKAGRWKNFAEYVNEIRANPGKRYNHGIVGPGRHDDLQIAEIEKMCGIKFNIVHYGSSNAIQTDILTGDLASGTIGCNRQNFVSNESFNVLALYGKSVPDDFPVHGLPFFADYADELGFKWEDAKYIPLVNGGTSVLINAKTDPAIVEAYKECLRRVSKNEKFREQIRNTSYPSFSEEKEALEVLNGVANAMKEALSLAPAK
jgi:tripartite-type tricarboxylate transporter receptor subunit TctC